ncbi:MAG: 4-vinyl reductase [Anaerolineales bacterium]|nr:4-vinyl reductase [Anaerolineales bacterium]
MIPTASTYYFPNRLGRMVLLAFEEVIGKSGINALLNLSSLPHLIDNYPPADDLKAVPFETIGQLQYTLEQAYGPHGGRGLALRAGRVFFSTCMRTYGTDLGFSDPTFRLQPPDSKIGTALKSLMDFFNRYTDQQISLEENEYNFLWRIGCCPWCWGRHESEPTCHFAVGMLQEALYWVSGGKFYNVTEETCISQGDKICLIAIDRIPLA